MNLFKEVTLAKKGFTLIELLIVVAIIAILAAIAIPNFLAAQVRSKVSRTQSEMRTLATGLEAYYVDNSSYPTFPNPELGQNAGYNDGWPENWDRLDGLTTPIAYITSLPEDPFNVTGTDIWTDGYTGPTLNGGTQTKIGPKTYNYNFTAYLEIAGGFYPLIPEATSSKIWKLEGYGPDRIGGARVGVFLNFTIPYDPTNGTVSGGDIFRFGP